MSFSNYDLPLQHMMVRRQIQKSPLNSEIDELISPIPTQQQDYEESTFSKQKQMFDNEPSLDKEKYDLPRQRGGDLFLKQNNAEYVEDRPAIVKTLFTQAYLGDHSQSCKRRQKIVQSGKACETLQTHLTQNLRLRVSSVYQRLLQQNKKKQKNDQISTEATFKPKDLKRQLSYHKHHKSVGESIGKTKTNSANRIQSNTKQNRKTTNPKKLEHTYEAKTKYEQILSQHFQPKFSSSSKKTEIYTTAQDIRLSKICGKNSTILKLKQRLNPNFCSIRDRNEIQHLKQNMDKFNINKKVEAQKCNVHVQQNQNKLVRKQLKDQKTKIKVEEKEKEKELKTCPSERWMSMNFYERQQRVISNRKQKQQIGKQKRIEQQIKPCTFKPELTKSKSQKLVQPDKLSYLEQYYQKLYRKY